MKSFLTLNSGNQIICYQDNAASKKYSLVFVHGNSYCQESFIHQVSDNSLSSKFRLITFDLPGHGQSPKSKDPKQYCLNGYVNVLVEIIEQLEIEKPILVGHSLGGHICIEATPQIDRLKGLVIFQTPPINSLETIAEAFPDISKGIPYQSDVSKVELAYYCKLLSQSEVQEVEQWFRQADPDARSYLGQSVTSGQFQDEIVLFDKLTIPKAIFHGEGDLLISLDYVQKKNLHGLWQNKVINIPESTHSPQIENPEFFNNTLKDFLTLLD